MNLNQAEDIKVGGKYARYFLVLLVLAYVINLVDRQILSILSEEIKADLGVSDSQLGFLYGTSFAVFYAVFGLPLGRLADLWVRKSLIALGLVGWSVMTMLSGTAGSYSTLALYRYGVGIGEASATPAAYSLLADLFKPGQRATVLATYTSGAYIGMGLSLFIGGWILDGWNNAYADITHAPFGLKAWQAVFIAVGLPGILMALLINSLREPRRGQSEGISSKNHPHPFRESWQELLAVLPPFSIYSLYKKEEGHKYLFINLAALVGLAVIASILITLTGDLYQWLVLPFGIYALFSWSQGLALRDRPTYELIFRSRAMIYANIAFPCIAFITFAFGFWMAPYFIRNFSVSVSEIGMVLGLSTAIGGGIGVVVGGVIADLLRRRAKDAHVYMGIVVVVLATPAALVILTTDDLMTAYIANAVLQFVGVLWSGAAASIVTELVLPRMRATAAAFYLAMATFIGLAMGPYVVGRISDLFAATGMDSAAALRQGLLVALSIFLLVILFILLTKRHLLQDLDTRQGRATAAGEPVESDF